MKATFKPYKDSNFNINHRKEDYFRYQFTAVVFNGKEAYDAVTLRLYNTEARSYCAIWICDNLSWTIERPEMLYRKATGFATGYQYHRESAAAEQAIRNAGIVLDEEISGKGYRAVEQAILAIARYMWPKKKYIIHITEANP